MNPIVITAITLMGIGLFGLITKREIVRIFGSILTFVLGLVLAVSSFHASEEAVLFSLIILVTSLIWTAAGVAIAYRRQRSANTVSFQENNRLKN